MNTHRASPSDVCVTIMTIMNPLIILYYKLFGQKYLLIFFWFAVWGLHEN
jgi:hypothetical protein